MRAWVTLALMSALFFIITAATFASLGVALPAMVAELDWSWTSAGFGFTLLGFFCGITSAVPASLIRRFGVRANLLAGSAGDGGWPFSAWPQADGLLLYFLGASLAGLGFTLLDSVPGTYLLSRLFARPSFRLRPVLHHRRTGRRGRAAALCPGDRHDRPLAQLLAGDRRGGGADRRGGRAGRGQPKPMSAPRREADPEISTEGWTLRDALQTRQFWIIAAAYTAFLFCGITANSVSVAHLTQHGVAAVIAGSMMSVEALLNSAARLAGGILTRFVSAKTLAGGGAGQPGDRTCWRWRVARDLPMMLLYAAGIGIGFGLTILCRHHPAAGLFRARPLSGTVLHRQPDLAPSARWRPPWRASPATRPAAFTPFFIGLAVLVALVMLAVVADARRRIKSARMKEFGVFLARRQRRLDRLHATRRRWMAAGSRIATPP